jgi:acetyl-CoA acetyltransferase family protein
VATRANSLRQAPHDAVIVAARRTPIGRRGGQFSTLHPHELLAATTGAAMGDAVLDGPDIDAIVCGCVTQVGDQAYNVGRMAALAAGMPSQVPAMSVDSQCGSSQQAVNIAATMVRSGAAEVVVASGVESMSRVPLGSAQLREFGTPFSQGYLDRYEVVAQGESAERIADKWGIDRRGCDEWAARSQRLAGRAVAEGRFRQEIVAIAVGDDIVIRDEGIRDSTVDQLAALRPAFRENGRHTAGNSSQISDGAATVVVMSRERATLAGLRPLAHIAGQAFVGVDPAIKLTGPIPATAKLLGQADLAVRDIGSFEVSEAFAAVVLAWLAETGADPERVNTNGGAIALGHPVGASGARMITTAAHELARSATEFSVVTMCCGGGLGTATLLAAE